MTPMAMIAGADKQATIHLGRLQVLNTYEEKYFIVNIINQGQCISFDCPRVAFYKYKVQCVFGDTKRFPADKVWEPTIIPVFLDIKLRVAKAPAGGDGDALRQYVDWATRCAATQNQGVTGTADIMVFEQEVVDNGLYDYAAPTTYLSCDVVSRHERSLRLRGTHHLPLL